MEELARRFCREARQRSGLRYPTELRQVALEYARVAARRGRTQLQIAEALELPEVTLCRWQKVTSEAIPVHEVVVVGDGAGFPVLVMPSGARVEGLTVKELVAVLGALG